MLGKMDESRLRKHGKKKAALPVPEQQHRSLQKMQDIRKAAPEHDKAWQRCKVNTIWSFRIRRVFPVCKIEVEAPYIYIYMCVCVCVCLCMAIVL